MSHLIFNMDHIRIQLHFHVIWTWFSPVCENRDIIPKRIIQNQKRKKNKILSNIRLDLETEPCWTKTMDSDTMDMLSDGRIQTSEQRDQNPLPYHLATPHFYFYWTLILIKNNIGMKCSSIPVQLSIENLSSL